MLRRFLTTSLALALAGSSVQAAPTYRVVDLGMLPGGVFSTPSSFGPGHTVLGSCAVNGGGASHAVRSNLASDGTVTSLTDLAGLDGFNAATAYGMNAAGWVTGTALHGGAMHAVVLIPVPSALAVGDAAPEHVALAQPWPNPARGDVRLVFTLSSGRTARLAIHDAQGRLVVRLADGAFAAGRHEQVWNGRDGNGSLVGPGLYFASFESGGRRESVRIVRVR